MPPQTLALFPSERACLMLVYVRLGCPVVVSVNVCRRRKWLRRTVAAAPLRLGCPAGYSGCDGVVMSGSQLGSGAVVRIAVGVRERDRRDRPPRHFDRIGAVESLCAPDGECRVGHRDVQDREQTIAVGHRQIVGARNLVRRLIPVDAGVPLPERRERRLILSTRRSRLRPSALTALKSSRVRAAGQTPRGLRLELGVVDKDERIGECQPLRAHRGRGGDVAATGQPLSLPRTEGSSR